MRMRRTLAYFVFACCVVLFVVKDRAAEVRGGDWTISKSDEAGKVEFSLIEHHHGGTNSHQSDWPAAFVSGGGLFEGWTPGSSLHDCARRGQDRVRRISQ